MIRDCGASSTIVFDKDMTLEEIEILLAIRYPTKDLLD